MGWELRTRRAVYTSPSGRRIPFSYEELNREFNRNTTGYNFPSVDGTYVQDLGSSDRRYPMRVIFWGDNYDRQAAAFEAALYEPGRGRLDHPRDGRVDVIPFGRVLIREDLVKNANQVIFEVEFWESTLSLFPNGQQNVKSLVGDASVLSFLSMIDDFASLIDLRLPTDLVTLKARLIVTVAVIRSRFKALVNQKDVIARQFNATADSIVLNIDTVESDPTTLAGQMTNLITIPSVIEGDVSGQLDAYVSVIEGITSGLQGEGNEFRSDELTANSALVAMALAAINGDFKTRTEAVIAAGRLTQQFDNLTAWRESNLTIDGTDTYQNIQNTIALSTGFLVSLSFTLLQERAIVLGRPRTIIDLVAELKHSVDDELDFFINTNDLSGDEIIELPIGRMITYYE